MCNIKFKNIIIMRKNERYKKVVENLENYFPQATTELHYENTYQLLVAVILSAQCTDKRVNMITPALFEAFPNPLELSLTTPEIVYTYIHSISYPNNKSKHLVGMAKILISDFNGIVPDEVDE